MSLEQNIAKIKAELAQMEEELLKQQQEKAKDHTAPFEFPEGGEELFYIDRYRVDSSNSWSKINAFDVSLIKHGKVSKNKNDLETIISMEDKWGQFRLKAIQLADGWKPDWKDNCQKKYCVFYDSCDDTFIIDYWFTHEAPFVVYLPTEEKAQMLADWANKNIEMK